MAETTSDHRRRRSLPGGEPLRAGHGAPVRLVVPGRRGPEWIKWVTRIDGDDRPAWFQPPLPLS